MWLSSWRDTSGKPLAPFTDGSNRGVQRILEQFRLELELFFASALGFTSEGASQEAAE